MKDLSPAIFLVPIITLVIVVSLYRYLLQKALNKMAFRRTIFNMLIIAFVLNWIWELLQAPLYKGFSYSVFNISFCTLASVADVTMVILLYFIFALIYKNPLWGQQPTLMRVLLVMIVGGIGAIVAESLHTKAGNWAYSDKMPIIPIGKVGLPPILQFLMLPVIIYYLSFQLLKIKWGKRIV